MRIFLLISLVYIIGLAVGWLLWTFTRFWETLALETERWDYPDYTYGSMVTWWWPVILTLGILRWSCLFLLVFYYGGLSLMWNKGKRNLPGFATRAGHLLPREGGWFQQIKGCAALLVSVRSPLLGHFKA